MSLGFIMFMAGSEASDPVQNVNAKKRSNFLVRIIVIQSKTNCLNIMLTNQMHRIDVTATRSQPQSHLNRDT
jgi:hypothetical protein